jgi:hypothetical protein
MKTWAVALDITFYRFATGEYRKDRQIILVKADTRAGAEDRARDKFLVGKEDPEYYSIRVWWCERVILSKIN